MLEGRGGGEGGGGGLGMTACLGLFFFFFFWQPGRALIFWNREREKENPAKYIAFRTIYSLSKLEN